MLQNNTLYETFLKIETMLLCFYIILAPISKCVQIYLFGYSIIVSVIVLLFIVCIISRILCNNLAEGNFSFILLTAFLIELVLKSETSQTVEIGLVLSVFLYIGLLSVRDIPLKRIYISFFIASFLSAIFSFIYGTETGEVTRTAVYVDGSISVITLIIVLFGNFDSDCGIIFDILRATAFFSSLIVLLFGMSRARIAIALILLAIWFIKVCLKDIANGRLDLRKVFFLLAIAILLLILKSQPTFQKLFESISERFDDGFSSLGRTEEIQIGWSIFKDNIVSGMGWGTFRFKDYRGNISSYYNHCMYIAVLARGGLLFGIPFGLSLLSILKKTFVHRDNYMLLMLTAVFLALGYGNAGVFNYTICSMLVPISILINKEGEKTNEKSSFRFKTGNRKSSSLHYTDKFIVRAWF